jgi:hypothetical protein
MAMNMSDLLMSAFLSATLSGALPDLVRDALQATADKWFHWLLISSAVVAVGVTLEIGEATITLKRWYRLWRGQEVAPVKETSWAIPASYIGLLFVIFGVVGEGIFEALVSNADTALRAHDSQVLARAVKDAGDAKSSSLVAADAAQHAKDASGDAIQQSDKAKSAASNALTIANGARQEADSFEKDIVLAKTQAAEAESHLAEALQRAAEATREADSFEQEIASAKKQAADAELHQAESLQRTIEAEEELNRIKTPRSLVNVSKFVSALEAFKGTEYTFSSVFGDEESIKLLRQIDGALQSAGWNRVSSVRLKVPRVA